MSPNGDGMRRGGYGTLRCVCLCVSERVRVNNRQTESEREMADRI